VGTCRRKHGKFRIEYGYSLVSNGIEDEIDGRALPNSDDLGGQARPLNATDFRHQ
jgi:hypothetical protein